MTVSVAPPTVAVIIAAYNAEATIDRAIASALAEPQVVEVVVVDDCSTDATREAALACDDGTGRLRVESLPTNAGPGGARNHAIAVSGAPFLAVLDSDDFFLPGRFTALFDLPAWDMAADDIAFVDETKVDSVDTATIVGVQADVRMLDAAGFVEACITRRGRHKRELGFLKVVWRRAFLVRHQLRYDETLRLAEDYELYTRALMNGARFALTSRCHYVAVERRGSLSDRHDERDLANLAVACRSLVCDAPPGNPVIEPLRRHERQIRRKTAHRAFLADKRRDGLVRALSDRANAPLTLATIAIDVARDKLGALSFVGRSGPRPADRGSVRYLLRNEVIP